MIKYFISSDHCFLLLYRDTRHIFTLQLIVSGLCHVVVLYIIHVFFSLKTLMASENNIGSIHFPDDQLSEKTKYFTKVCVLSIMRNKIGDVREYVTIPRKFPCQDSNTYSVWILGQNGSSSASFKGTIIDTSFF